MGFFNVSDAMALGLIEGADMAFENIRVQEKEDYDNAKRKAEKASIVAANVEAKYKEMDKESEIYAQSMLKNVAFQNAITNVIEKNPDQFQGVSAMDIAKKFGKSFLLHGKMDRNDSPDKWASRAALDLNRQLKTNTLDPDILALADKIKSTETPLDTQTKELTFLEKMTPKGKTQQMTDSFRGPGREGESFDLALKGGTPTAQPKDTEALVSPARPRLIGSQIKDISNAIVNEVTGKPIRMEGENVIYPNTNTFDKKVVTKEQAQQLNAQLSTIDREFKGFVRNFSSIIDVDDPATLNDVAKVFKEIAIDKTTFAVDTDKLRNLDQNTVLQMMREVGKTPKKQPETPDKTSTDTSDKGKPVATENVPNEARQRFEKSRETGGGNTVVMDGKTYTFIERPNKTLEVYVK
jgi:phage gp16-like protein